VIRPEKVFFIHPGEPEEGLNTVEGTIQEIIYIGDVTKFKIRTSMTEDFALKRQNRLGVEKCQIGNRVKIGWKIEDTTVL
jgi:putative spermidine/putrescine transport system ATP-binding protein